MRYLLILATVIILIPSIVSGSEHKIQTTSGITHGYIQNSVVNWDDIPYAQPPIGDLRWRAPLKLESSEYLNIIILKRITFAFKNPPDLADQMVIVFFLGQRIVYI